MKVLSKDVDQLPPERHDYLYDKVDYCSQGQSIGFSYSMQAYVPGPVDYEMRIEKLKEDLGPDKELGSIQREPRALPGKEVGKQLIQSISALNSYACSDLHLVPVFSLSQMCMLSGNAYFV